MRPSERCRRDAELIGEFRAAYVDLINSTVPVREDEYASPILKSKIDNPSWQRKRSALAAAAGAAGVAYSRYGGTYTLRNAAYIMNDVDPVTNWEMSLRDPEQLAPETVIAAVDAAISRAMHEAEECEQRESGLTGLIAAFLRWPSNLREAVGYEHPTQRRAAGAIGVAGQVVAGALATALAAGLIAGVVAIWRLVA